MIKLWNRPVAKVTSWSNHPYATRYLMGLSFIEAIFFPVPPDVMLAPMSLTRPERAWYFAMITTLASVAGGIIGYLLGQWAYEPIVLPILEWLNYHDHFIVAESYFKRWGFWVVFLAGFTPLPYKVFTVAAGVMNVAFLPFVIASILGRGARFYLVAGGSVYLRRLWSKIVTKATPHKSHAD